MTASKKIQIKHWSDIPRLPWGGNAAADLPLANAIQAFKKGKPTSEQNFIEILANHYQCGEDVLSSFQIVEWNPKKKK